MDHDLSLAAHDLAPRRGGRVVAQGVSFSLVPGEALLLRGGNGAGKTSVLRAVAGLCPAGGGVAFARSGAPLDPAAARADAVHYLGAEEGLSARESPAETVRGWAALYGASARGALGEVGLAEQADMPCGALSTGQRRRLGLARLLLAPRALWLLDEPLSGLDEAGRTLFLSRIEGHRARGGLVLMASHEAGLPGAATLRLSEAAA